MYHSSSPTCQAVLEPGDLQCSRTCLQDLYPDTMKPLSRSGAVLGDILAKAVSATWYGSLPLLPAQLHTPEESAPRWFWELLVAMSIVQNAVDGYYALRGPAAGPGPTPRWLERASEMLQEVHRETLPCPNVINRAGSLGSAVQHVG